MPTAVTKLVSYTVEIEIRDVPSSEVNGVIQWMTLSGAAKSELIIDENPSITNCTIRAWFERLSPIGEEKIRYKVGLHLPQSKIFLYRKTIKR